jgi:hypothetical protein
LCTTIGGNDTGRLGSGDHSGDPEGERSHRHGEEEEGDEIDEEIRVGEKVCE